MGQNEIQKYKQEMADGRNVVMLETPENDLNVEFTCKFRGRGGIVNFLVLQFSGDRSGGGRQTCSVLNTFHPGNSFLMDSTLVAERI